MGVDTSDFYPEGRGEGMEGKSHDPYINKLHDRITELGQQVERLKAALEKIMPVLERHMVHEDENEFYQAFIVVKQALKNTDGV